ncbi:MAG: hypothetical protein K0B37_11455 [Bacteroidales bacterium]|nr:hypothetical protein [Bacteroidales bacterium]
MLEFIYVPVIFGIVTLGIYKIFELFVRRKERLLMIEKFGQSSEGLDLSQGILFPAKQNKSFAGLKAACLLLGLGLGLLVGFFIISYWQTHIPMENRMAFHVRETANIIYGASVLLFGGLGLLVAFFLEQRYIQKDKSQKS